MNLFNDKIKFIHFRKFVDGKPAARGGHTVAYFVDTDGLIRAADAHCSRKDNFCYRTGRMVAVQRLKDSREFFMAAMSPKKFREEIDRTVSERLGLSRVYSRKNKRAERSERSVNDSVELG